MRYNKIIIACIVVLSACVAESADEQDWWYELGVIDPEAVKTNDYAPVNLGQLKNISMQAIYQCSASGMPHNNEYNVLDSVLFSWVNEEVPVNYMPANVGQVKYMGSLFHGWLASAGYRNAMCFQPGCNDYALANIGQVKNVFNFDPSDTDYNRFGIIGGWLEEDYRERVDGDDEIDIAYWHIFGSIPEQVYYGSVGDVVLELRFPPWVSDEVVYPQKTWWRRERNARSPVENYFLSSSPYGAGGWKSHGLKLNVSIETCESQDYDIPQDDSIFLSSLPNGSSTTETVIHIVYTGGGIIELDRDVYLLQWAPRVKFEAAVPEQPDSP